MGSSQLLTTGSAPSSSKSRRRPARRRTPMRGGGFQGVTAATNSMVRRRSIPRRNSQRLQGTAAVDLKVRRTEPAPRRGRFCRSPETKLEAPP
ncbi:hypothetical protein EJB05_27000, partial [Eragrostis curvula]